MFRYFVKIFLYYKYNCILDFCIISKLNRLYACSGTVFCINVLFFALGFDVSPLLSQLHGGTAYCLNELRSITDILTILLLLSAYVASFFLLQVFGVLPQRTFIKVLYLNDYVEAQRTTPS